MTPEQQRIAIAKACGWKWHSRMKGSIKVWDNRLDYVFSDSELPDYLNDLNAMHKAEKTLDYNQMNRYQNIELSRFVHTETTWICSATAAQRAEAFLRTLGRWEEEA